MLTRIEKINDFPRKSGGFRILQRRKDSGGQARRNQTLPWPRVNLGTAGIVCDELLGFAKISAGSPHEPDIRVGWVYSPTVSLVKQWRWVSTPTLHH